MPDKKSVNPNLSKSYDEAMNSTTKPKYVVAKPKTKPKGKK